LNLYSKRWHLVNQIHKLICHTNQHNRLFNHVQCLSIILKMLKLIPKINLPYIQKEMILTISQLNQCQQSAKSFLSEVILHISNSQYNYSNRTNSPLESQETINCNKYWCQKSGLQQSTPVRKIFLVYCSNHKHTRAKENKDNDKLKVLIIQP
jgi:hypothetical protein